jgi:hypothetical protein
MEKFSIHFTTTQIISVFAEHWIIEQHHDHQQYTPKSKPHFLKSCESRHLPGLSEPKNQMRL